MYTALNWGGGGGGGIRELTLGANKIELVYLNGNNAAEGENNCMSTVTL